MPFEKNRPGRGSRRHEGISQGAGSRDGYAPRRENAPRGGDAPRRENAPRGGYAPRRENAQRGGDAPRRENAPRGGDAPRGGYEPRQGYEPREGQAWRGRSQERPTRPEDLERGGRGFDRSGPRKPAFGEYSQGTGNPPGRKADARFRGPGRRPAPPVAPALWTEAAPREELPERDMPRENLLLGRNPIREAVKSGRDLERLLVARGDLSGSAREIVAMARERRIVVQQVDRQRLDEIAPHHQGMIAFASAFRYAAVEDMLAKARERGEAPLLVILDGVTDPHNLGAIIRSAECAGAHGVIVPERRAVGLTPAAVKASAGAVEYLPVARTGSLSRLIGELKEEGLWIVAADPGGERYTGADLTGPMALVIGGEGEGVSRLVGERCDRRVSIPMAGRIDSLNASVAAGVLLYEIRRQRG